MKDYKRMIFVSIIIALASQISIGLMASDFRVSAGIISFVIFLYYYKDLKPIPMGILSGIMVYLLRLGTYYISNGNLDHVITSYLFEILFYVFYSIIYSIMINKDNRNNINFVFFTMITSDFSANFMELFVRSSIEKSQFPRDVIFTLFFVSIIRSSVVWIWLNGFKYYKMLLLKEEHENRYKRLLWFTSQLKTEIYWIEKNMDNIEKVMSQSYELFEKINLNEDSGEWGDRALSIARDVHEIKKENGLVIRGIQDITEKELKDKGMDFKDIMNILYETMNREIRLLDRDIELAFEIKETFYTYKHYYLMSMFRNLIMNSIDAIPDSQRQGKISVIHEIDEDEHCFIIADNGSGMDETSLKEVFSPGFSTKINYDTGEINRGLGLSIVQYIVEEQLGGKISLSSQVGQGTSFYIKILKSKLEENSDEDIYC